MSAILKLLLLMKLCCSFPFLFAQDSLQSFGFDDYLTIVKKFHPLAKQAELQTELGAAELMYSKGGFDPKAFGDINQKYFDDKQYYSLIDAGLKIPTWFGVEVYSGYEQGEGVNINPQRYTPDEGLVYAGVSVSLGKGLFMDERRAQLKKAKIYNELTLEERRLLVNDLLLDASNVYWSWYAAAQKIKVVEKSIELAKVRFKGIKSSALMGESPTIDTLEALIQLQNREILLQNAVLEYENAKEALNVYLWNENQVPLEISDRIEPPSNEELFSKINVLQQEGKMDSLIHNHPYLKKNQLYINQLEIERRLKLEQIKPQVDLKYNAINEPVNGDVFNAYSINNYKWGLTFSMPLFLRKGRAAVKKADVKIQDQKLELEYLQAKLKSSVNSAVNTWETTQTQINIYNQTVVNVEKLVEGEQKRFDVGESSLFLVNQREMSLIKAQIDFIKMIAKNQQAFIKVQYSLGVLD